MIYLNKTYLGLLFSHGLISGSVGKMKILTNGKKLTSSQKELIEDLDYAEKTLKTCIENLNRLDLKASELQKENVTLQLSLIEQSKSIDKLKQEIDELKRLL